MPNVAGQIVINVSAGTAQMVVDLDRAKAKLRDFTAVAEGAGRGATSSMYAASGAVRLLEGNVENNVRAVERFLTQTLKLGPVIQAAFPLIGGAAFLGLLVKMGTEATAFYQKLAEAPQRIATAFRVLNESSRLSNDQMQLANDKLEADIAKLQGKRENNLKIALDEAKVAADDLAKSLDTAIGNLQKLAKEEDLGFFKSLVTNQRSTAGNDEGLKRFRDQVASAMATGNANIRNAGTDTTARDAAETERNIHLQNIYNGEIERRNALLKEAQKLQDYHDGKNQAPTYAQYVEAPKGTYAPYGIQATTPDQSVFIQQQKGAVEQLQYELDGIALAATNEKDKKGKGGAEADHAARVKAEETVNRLADELAKAREAQADAMERIDIEENEELQRLQEAGQINAANLATVAEIYDIRRLTEYNKLMEEYNKKIAENAQQWEIAGIKAKASLSEMMGKDVEAGLKQLEEHAKAITKLAEEYNKITGEYATESQRHRVEMAGINGNPNDPLGTLRNQQAIEAAAIESVYEQKLKLANTDLEKAIALREKNLALQRLQNQYEEEGAKLRQKNLNDFMIEMQGTTQSVGNILYQAAHSALDTVSADLAKLTMGEHKQVNIGKDMQRIGGSIAQSAIKSALQMAIGHFGKKAIHKPTFNPGDPGHVIVDNMPNGGNLPGGPTIANAAGVPGMAGVAGRSNSAGSALGGLFGGLLNGLGGGGSSGAESVSSSIEFLADGGDTYPGRNYVVGDGGEPEMFSPGVRGTVTPFSKMGGGGTTILNIDARGTDPVLTEMRVRQAVFAAHNSAVVTGVQANAERAKRTVQRQ